MSNFVFFTKLYLFHYAIKVNFNLILDCLKFFAIHVHFLDFMEGEGKTCP